jgi:hypothetical protein
MNKQLLFLIGIYLILDGLISILYFRSTATSIEQFFRVIRMLIGLYLLSR